MDRRKHENTGQLPILREHSRTGNTCSPPAKAAFNITGPTDVSVDVTKKDFEATLNLPDTEVHEWDIVYAGQATPPPSTSGTFTWVQLIQSISLAHSFSDGSSNTCSSSLALDTGYPYPFSEGLSSSDTPMDPLGFSGAEGGYETKATDSYQFQDYLMWNPDTDPDSIPVPLGSFTWKAVGTITYNSAAKAWGEESGGTTPAKFSGSTSYPLWQVAINAETLENSCKFTP